MKSQLASLLIEADRELSVNVDGESFSGQRLDYHARANDLWVHVAQLPGEVLSG